MRAERFLGIEAINTLEQPGTSRGCVSSSRRSVSTSIAIMTSIPLSCHVSNHHPSPTAVPALRKTRGELMKDVDAEYYGYRDEDDGVLLPLEAQYEKQGAAADSCRHHHHRGWSGVLKFVCVCACSLAGGSAEMEGREGGTAFWKQITGGGAARGGGAEYLLDPPGAGETIKNNRSRAYMRWKVTLLAVQERLKCGWVFVCV